MNILVIGAGGKTGTALVNQARAKGHTVTAFVHSAAEYEKPTGVRVLEGDVLNAATVEQAVQGQDAVLDALGGHAPWKETSLETNAARNIIDAMHRHGVKRLLVVSAIGAGGTGDLGPAWYEHLVKPTLLRGVMQDKEHMEPEVKASQLEWTLVRPPHLVDDPAIGKVTVVEPGAGETVHKITRADLAAFMLDALESGQYKQQAVNIASC